MLKKRTTGLSRNSVRGRKNPTRKKVHSKSRKIVKKKEKCKTSGFSRFFLGVSWFFLFFLGFLRFPGNNWGAIIIIVCPDKETEK